MRTAVGQKINIASQPFKRERAQNAMYAGLCLTLALSFCVITALVVKSRAEATTIKQQIQRQNIELARLQLEEGQFSSVLAKPENTDVFSMSVFLNQLIARRAISWTKVFEDLATVLPSNMRIEAIRLPQAGAEELNGVNHVQLDMVVGTDRSDTVIELLKHLQASSRFGSAAVINQAPPTQNDPLFKYRVTVSYAQKL